MINVDRMIEDCYVSAALYSLLRSKDLFEFYIGLGGAEEHQFCISI
jgi:hypothetical protein